MKRPPSLVLAPRPSRIAGAFVAASCLATGVLAASLPMPWWVLAAALLVVAAVGARAFRRCAGCGVPALVRIGDDRRLTVTPRAGASQDGIVLAETYVGAWLTCIVWRPLRAPWWHPARTLLFLPDTLSPDAYRRLRVLLRYGVTEVREATSGLDAG